MMKKKKKKNKRKTFLLEMKNKKVYNCLGINKLIKMKINKINNYFNYPSYVIKIKIKLKYYWWMIIILIY